MSFITLIFVLCGALANKTILLGGRYQFTDGRLEVTGEPGELKKFAHHLAVNWQAFPEGDPRIQEINDEFNKIHQDTGDTLSQLQTDDQLNGTGLDPEKTADSQLPVGGQAGDTAQHPDGDGQQKIVINEKLKAAILAIDPTDDSLWTATGQPTMKAVAALYGSEGITRADVEEAAPGYNRTLAQANA